jgi:hypothetical protein
MTFFSQWRIPISENALFNARMKTIDQIRRERLQLLRHDFGGVGKLAEQLGKSSSQVSQWLNASAHSETGRSRVIADDSAREIEEKCGRPVGWMDTDIDRVEIAAVQFLFSQFFAATEEGQAIILDTAKVVPKK